MGRSRQKVNEAEEKLIIAQKELQKPIKEKLEIEKQELTLARSRQKVEEGKEKLAVEQKKLKNLETLSAKGFIPRDELEQQQATVRESQASLKELRLEVKTNSIEIRRLKAEKQQKTEQQEKVLNARSELQEARSTVDTNVRELQRLKVDRDNTEEQLKNNIITAPISGKILGVKVNQGDGVKPGDVLLTLGNPQKELVKLKVNTLDAGKIKVGQLARITVIGMDSKEFTGRVKNVSPQATSGDSGGGGSGGMGGGSSGQARVPTTVELSKPTRTLIPGSKVSVEIVVEQRPKVVAVNLEAINRTEEKPFVWVLDDGGKAQKRNVTLGLE
ncbi:MAG: HlyD family efflux transporter periplasmic adaptor subunit, partial [Cyanobacteria bacterium J06649_11]